MCQIYLTMLAMETCAITRILYTGAVKLSCVTAVLREITMCQLKISH